MLKKREWKERNETDKWPDLLGAVSNTWFTRQHSTSLASPLKINFISKRLRFFIIRKKNFVEDINGYILIVSIVELTRFLHQIQRVRIRRSQCLIIRQRCIVRSKVNIDVNSIVDCLFMVICLTVVKYTCLFFSQQFTVLFVNSIPVLNAFHDAVIYRLLALLLLKNLRVKQLIINN